MLKYKRPTILILAQWCMIISLSAQSDQKQAALPKWRLHMSAGFSATSLSKPIAAHMDQSGFGDTDGSFTLLALIPLDGSTDYPQKDGSNGFMEIGVDYRINKSGWIGCRFGLDPSAGASGFNRISTSSTSADFPFFPLYYSSSDHGHLVYQYHSSTYIGLIYTYVRGERIQFSVGPTLDFNLTTNRSVDREIQSKGTSLGSRLGIDFRLNSWLGLTADWRWRESVSFSTVSNSYKNETGQVITSYLPGETFPMHYFRLGFRIRTGDRSHRKKNQ